MCWPFEVLGLQLWRKFLKPTLFGGEGAININKLLMKTNIIINCRKVNKEKHSETKACGRRLGPGWENPELFPWFWKGTGVGAESIPGRGNGSLIKRLSWILSFSFSTIQSKDNLFVAQLSEEAVMWKQSPCMTASFPLWERTTSAFWAGWTFQLSWCGWWKKPAIHFEQAKICPN